MDRHLSAAEVAERLAVSRSWVYKHKRLLGGVQVGHRMWRFPEEGIQAYLASAASRSNAETSAPGRDSRRAVAPPRRQWWLDY
jgi:excisionase family DNA binding protein